MRRQITLLVAATTSIVLLAFLLPAGVAGRAGRRGPGAGRRPGTAAVPHPVGRARPTASRSRPNLIGTVDGLRTVAVRWTDGTWLGDPARRDAAVPPAAQDATPTSGTPPAAAGPARRRRRRSLGCSSPPRAPRRGDPHLAGPRRARASSCCCSALLVADRLARSMTRPVTGWPRPRTGWAAATWPPARRRRARRRSARSATRGQPAGRPDRRAAGRRAGGRRRPRAPAAHPADRPAAGRRGAARGRPGAAARRRRRGEPERRRGHPRGAAHGPRGAGRRLRRRRRRRRAGALLVGAGRGGGPAGDRRPARRRRCRSGSPPADLGAAVDALLGNVFAHTPEGTAVRRRRRGRGPRGATWSSPTPARACTPRRRARPQRRRLDRPRAGHRAPHRRGVGRRLRIASSPGGTPVTLELGPAAA